MQKGLFGESARRRAEKEEGFAFKGRRREGSAAKAVKEVVPAAMEKG